MADEETNLSGHGGIQRLLFKTKTTHLDYSVVHVVSEFHSTYFLLIREKILLHKTVATEWFCGIFSLLLLIIVFL